MSDIKDSGDNNDEIQLNQQVSEGMGTTKYICKTCGLTFENQNNLDSHITSSHHPKRTVTLNDIINGAFKGQINFPKTKAEIIKQALDLKGDPAVTPEVLDILNNLPDKRYNNEAELTLALNFTGKTLF